MRSVCNDINNAGGYHISKAMLGQFTLKSLKAFEAACSKLVELGYIPSASRFNEFEAALECVEDIELDWHLCRNINTGVVDLSPLRLQYIKKYLKLDGTMCRMSTNQAIKRLDIVIDALRWHKNLHDVLNFQQFRMPATKDDYYVKTGLCASRFLYGNNNLVVDNPDLMECTVYDRNCKIKKMDLNRIRLEYLKGQLGLSGGILGKGFTEEDDALFYPLLVSGDVIGETANGKALFEKVAEQAHSGDVRTLKELVFTGSLDVVDAEIKKVKADEDIDRTLFVTEDAVYFLTKTKVYSHSKPIHEHYIGSYLIDNIENEAFSIYAQLMGYGGEFISVADVNEPVKALPMIVPLIGSDGYLYEVPCYSYDQLHRVYPFFDIYDVDDYVGYTSVWDNKARELYGVSRIEDIGAEVTKLLVAQGYPLHKARLIGELITAHACVKYNYNRQYHDSPAQVILSSYLFGDVTEAQLSEACLEAQDIIQKL